MKYIKSTTQKVWKINGHDIPACITPDNSYLTLADEDYAIISKSPIMHSLVSAGQVLVLDTKPEDMGGSDVEGQDIAKYTAEITRLKEELANAKSGDAGEPVDIEAIKAQAQEEIKAEAVKELQEKQQALDESAAKLAAAQKEIESLKKKANK